MSLTQGPTVFSVSLRLYLRLFQIRGSPSSLYREEGRLEVDDGRGQEVRRGERRTLQTFGNNLSTTSWQKVTTL